MGAFLSGGWLLPEGLVVEGLRREAGVVTGLTHEVSAG